jgi:hypothetical protein
MFIASMEPRMASKNAVDHQAEFVDVQLLDVLAQVEAVLRHGREIQREALRVRGVPNPVNAEERRATGTALRRRVDQMGRECNVLCDVVRDLCVAAEQLENLLGGAAV